MCLVLLFVCAILNNLVLLVMRIEVNRRMPPAEKMSWWRRDFKNETARKYASIEPGSILPAVASITLWGCIMAFVVMISTVILNR